MQRAPFNPSTLSSRPACIVMRLDRKDDFNRPAVCMRLWMISQHPTNLCTILVTVFDSSLLNQRLPMATRWGRWGPQGKLWHFHDYVWTPNGVGCRLSDQRQDLIVKCAFILAQSKVTMKWNLNLLWRVMSVGSERLRCLRWTIAYGGHWNFNEEFLHILIRCRRVWPHLSTAQVSL
jgi:hypothetical protein